ncbi:MAG TPA: tetratricopeptide repeat protein [Opitutaceae bacterium]|nr:tetratricopeptide repeat protein [Opitutaceae bacterium]
MSKPASPSDSNSTGIPVPVPPVGVNPDEWVKGIWDKNKNFILGGISLVILVIIGWGGWNYYASQHELGIEQEYANATGPDSLRAFVQAHPDHPLAAMAQLRVADAAYEAGQIAAAQAAYQQALDKLPAGIFASRARLGIAICQIQSGQEADGAAALHQLADDTKQAGSVRAEALYHLGSLAAAAGKADEVRQLSVQAIQADASSPWTQRLFGLQQSLPPPPAAAAKPGAPAAPIALPKAK